MDIKARAIEVLGRDELFYALLVLLVGVTAFGLGRLSAGTVSEPAASTVPSVEYSRPTTVSNQPASLIVASTTQKAYVASKNSTKYHLPWCSGAKRISEENKVWFASKEEVEKTGRTPASNCPGI